MLIHKLKKNKGITLIALVVTIIVLLILAGISISMLTGQNGILNRAQEAKNKTQVANEKEAVNMAAMEALTKEILTKTMKSYLGKNDVELTGNEPWQYAGSDGAYTIGASGKVAQGWVYVYDNTQEAKEAPVGVTNGKIILNIGDYINYNPGTTATYTSEVGITQSSTYTTNGPNWSGETQNWNGFRASDYQKALEDPSNSDKKNYGNGAALKTYLASQANSVKWQVIGADEETGDLLIFANNNVGDNLQLKGITGYLHGVDELNNACNVYGQGKGATGGRSLTLDDTNKLLGRDNTKINEKWTFKWKKDSLTNKAPYVTSSVKEGYLYFSHLIKDTKTGIFNYYDETTKKWVTNTKDLNNIQNDEGITTLTRDFSGYSSLDEKYTKTKGYNVIFKANGSNVGSETQYWLGSSYMNVGGDGTHVYYATLGLYYVNSPSNVNGNGTYNSFGYVSIPSFGVRPVVSLKSDIQLEQDKASSEVTYNIK